MNGRRWLTLLGGCIALLAFGWLLRTVDWAVLRAIGWQRGAFLAATTIAMLVAHAAGAAALLAGLGYRAPVGRVAASMLAASIVGMAGDPKLGVPARLYFYQRLAGVPLSIGLSQTVVESALWLGLMALIVALPAGGNASAGWVVSSVTLALLLGGAAALALGPALGRRVPGVRLLFDEGNRVGRFVLSVRSSLLGIRKGALLVATAWLGSTYVVDIGTLWYLALVHGHALDVLQAGHAIVLSYLAGAISFLPLGLGVRDVALSVLLQQAGLPAGDAASIAVVHRVIRTLVPLALGAVLMPFLRVLARPGQSRPPEP